MVVCGLKVTVLWGLGGVELEGVGCGRSGDVSVELEGMAGVRLLRLTRFTSGFSRTSRSLGVLTGADSSYVVASWRIGEYNCN